MKYPENIAEVSKLQPDFLGFIFWEKSPRFFDVEIPKLPDSIQKVGVFVDASLEEIRSKKKQYNLNIIQLHGNETVDFCSNLKQDDILIIKVFSIDDTFDFTALEPFEDVCDYFLFDTKGKMPGGNGTTFNWELLKKYNSKKSLFLSGGIGIEEIIKIKHLNLPIYAIDLNSKFEIEPGLKNIEQLQEILPLKNKKK
uniref:phosphoribosylanthranilate isomerase n=1 Tax=Flavobacterium soli TaxID=344881 RepID=UPI00040E8F29|nr:phosphoribosylanthranilate isomerase [Flavobacterium soli]